MLIAHLADIHIGHRQYGLEQRAEDYALAFRKAIDKLLKLAEEEELEHVVISGDLFDTTRPTPAAYITVIDCLRKLAEVGVRVYVIRGNHEAPVVNPVENPLKVLASMGLVTYLERDYVDIGKVRIIGHGCVYTEHQQKLYSALTTLTDPNRVNVVLLHQYVEGTPFLYYMPNVDYYAINSKVVKTLIADRDGIFLCGHIHEHNLRHPELPVIYSGSLEIWDSREFETYKYSNGKLVKVQDQAPKGFLLVKISESSGKFRVKPIKIEPTRRMIKIEMEYDELDPVTFRRDMLYLIENFDIPDAYLQIEVRGRLREGYSTRDLQSSQFRRMFHKVLRADIKLDVEKPEKTVTRKNLAVTQTYRGIEDIIRKAVKQVLAGDAEADKVSELIIRLIEKAEEGDKSGILNLLEKYIGVNIKPEKDITSLLFG